MFGNSRNGGLTEVSMKVFIKKIDALPEPIMQEILKYNSTHEVVKYEYHNGMGYKVFKVTCRNGEERKWELKR